jgi:Ion channel
VNVEARRAMTSAARTWKRLRHYFGKWQEQSREPGLTALLLIEGFLIFLIIPLAGMGWLPSHVLAIAFVLLVAATLVVTSRSHIATLIVAVSVALSPFGSFVHAEHPSLLTDWVSVTGRLVAISALSIVIAKAVFGSGNVTWHRVQGAIVLYMNFALFFFTLYRFLDNILPNAFNGLPETGAEHGTGAALLYFSFSTLSTVGYGDITPVHPLVRNFANLEAVIGQLYPATLLARLVSLELEHRRRPREK